MSSYPIAPEEIRYMREAIKEAREGIRNLVFESQLGERSLPDGFLTELGRDECLKLFEEYAAMDAERY